MDSRRSASEILTGPQRTSRWQGLGQHSWLTSVIEYNNQASAAIRYASEREILWILLGIADLAPMLFDSQPTLKGALVELRPLRAEDADALYAVASDPLIWQQHPSPRYKPDVFSAFFRESLASRGALTVLDCQDGRIIGSSRFHGYNEAASEVEIGWTFLARSHWGGKYNREMKQLMLRHAFQFVRRVVFLIGPANLRSQKAIEKLGGVCVGRRPDASGRDSYLYEITSLPA